MSSLLFSHLKQEYAATGAFLELLDAEAEAMIQGHFFALPELAERKSLLADQIALFSRQREAELVNLGYAADRGGADAAVAAGGVELQSLWSSALARAAQARDHNHRNGVMIHTHLDFTRQSIRVLQAGNQPLYGPDGTHHQGTPSGNSLALG